MRRWPLQQAPKVCLFVNFFKFFSGQLNMVSDWPGEGEKGCLAIAPVKLCFAKFLHLWKKAAQLIFTLIYQYIYNDS